MFIYKITNNINGMVYIGRTKCVYRRWREHCGFARRGKTDCKLYDAIREYGPENFTVTTIDHAVTKDEADEKEVFWIKYYNAVEEGYNTSPGGRNGGHRRRVKAVEDGLVFDTMVEAAKHYGRAVGAIWQAVDKPHLTAAGQHWITVKK